MDCRWPRNDRDARSESLPPSADSPSRRSLRAISSNSLRRSFLQITVSALVPFARLSARPPKSWRRRRFNIDTTALRSFVFSGITWRLSLESYVLVSSALVQERQLPTEDQYDAATPVKIDARRHPRFKLEVDISIHSRTCGLLKGRTVDISESGIAAMLRIEAPLGEVVELSFTLPYGPVTILATVRQRNAFRYGFQFLDSNDANEVIRSTCHQLAVEQSPSSNDSGTRDRLSST